jgi:hypothetical protein
VVAAVRATDESSSSACGVYYAPSTIPGAGFGLFAGIDFDEGEEVTPGGTSVLTNEKPPWWSPLHLHRQQAHCASRLTNYYSFFFDNNNNDTDLVVPYVDMEWHNQGVDADSMKFLWNEYVYATDNDDSPHNPTVRLLLTHVCPGQ